MKNWELLKKEVENADPDFVKLEQGQKAGGKRARKSMMAIKKLAAELRKEITTQLKAKPSKAS